MTAFIPPPTIYKCLFQIDGQFVNGECVPLPSDTGGGWHVMVWLGDAPVGKTKRDMLRTWEKQYSFSLDKPSYIQFEVPEGDERLKVLYGETVYI